MEGTTGVSAAGDANGGETPHFKHLDMNGKNEALKLETNCFKGK